MEVCTQGKKPQWLFIQTTKACIKNYICDFLCTELMLVIEVDGITHWDEEVIAKDIVKQKKLEEVGFTVLRFNDEDVLQDIDNLERVLLGFIDDFERLHPLTPASGGH